MDSHEPPDNILPLFPGLAEPFGRTGDDQAADADPTVNDGAWGSAPPARSVVTDDDACLVDDGLRDARSEDELPDFTYRRAPASSSRRTPGTRLSISQIARFAAGVLAALIIGATAYAGHAVLSGTAQPAKAPAYHAAVIPIKRDRAPRRSTHQTPPLKSTHSKPRTIRHRQIRHRHASHARPAAVAVAVTHSAPQTSGASSATTVTHAVQASNEPVSQPQQSAPSTAQQATTPTQSSTGAAGSGSTAGASSSTSSPSSSARKTPAFGAKGTLGPGSSPNS